MEHADKFNDSVVLPDKRFEAFLGMDWLDVVLTWIRRMLR